MSWTKWLFRNMNYLIDIVVIHEVAVVLHFALDVTLRLHSSVDEPLRLSYSCLVPSHNNLPAFRLHVATFHPVTRWRYFDHDCDVLPISSNRMLEVNLRACFTPLGVS